MNEADIAVPIRPFLEAQGWEVFEEVSIGYADKVADLIARKGDRLRIVEVKARLGLRLLDQIWEWEGYAEELCVAYPRFGYVRKTRFLLAACGALGIGIFEISPGTAPNEARHNDCIKTIAEPTEQEEVFEPMKKRILASLCDGQKTHARAGSSRGGYWTAFKATVEAVTDFVRDHPGSTTREIVAGVAHHYSSDKAARSTLPRQAAKLIPLVRIDESVRPARWFPKESP